MVYEYWCIYCTLFPLELKALGNSTLIEADALGVCMNTYARHTVWHIWSDFAVVGKSHKGLINSII